LTLAVPPSRFRAEVERWPGSENAIANMAAAVSSLPGNGLVRHDFFYAGEAKTRDM
jgi:hypothetical protein